MKTIYVLTSQYMPLIEKPNFITPSVRAMSNNRIIHTQNITNEHLEKAFDHSKDHMLAFKNQQDAIAAMGVGLKGNTTATDFIDGDIPFFGVPVVFTVEIEDDSSLEQGKKLTGEMLQNYLETNSIPLFYAKSEQGFWKESIVKMMDNKIATLDSCPEVYSISKAAIVNKIHAYYLAANPVRDANVTLARATRDLEDISKQEAAPRGPGCSIL